MNRYHIISTSQDVKYLWKVWDCIDKQSIAEFVDLQDARLFIKSKELIHLEARTKKII